MDKADLWPMEEILKAKFEYLFLKNRIHRGELCDLRIQLYNTLSFSVRLVLVAYLEPEYEQ